MIALDQYGGGSGGDVDLNGVYNQIADVSAKVGNLTNSISGFSSSIDDLNSSVSELNDSVSGFSETISLLNDTVSILGNSVSDFGNSIDAFRNDMSELYGMSEYVSTISNLITGIQTTVYQPYYLPATQMDSMYNASGVFDTTRHYMNGISLTPTFTNYSISRGPLHWYNHDSNGVFSSCKVDCNTYYDGKGVDVAGFSKFDKITLLNCQGTIRDGDIMDSCSLTGCNIDIKMRRQINNGYYQGNELAYSGSPWVYSMSAAQFSSNSFKSAAGFITAKTFASNTFTYCPVVDVKPYNSFINNSVANGSVVDIEKANAIYSNTINSISVVHMDGQYIGGNSVLNISALECKAMTCTSNTLSGNTVVNITGNYVSKNTLSQATVFDCRGNVCASNSFYGDTFLHCAASRFSRNTLSSNYLCNIDAISMNGCSFPSETGVLLKISSCDNNQFSTIHTIHCFAGRFSQNTVSINTFFNFTGRTYSANVLADCDRATVNGLFFVNNSFAAMNELVLKPQSTYGHMNNTFANIKKLTFEGPRMGNNYYKSIDELECDLLQYHDMTRTNGSFTVNYNYYVSSNFFYESANTAGSTHFIYDTDLKYNKLISTFPESKIHVRELNLVPYVRSCMESLKDIANSTDPVIKFNQISDHELKFSLYPPSDLDTDLFVRTFKNNPYYYDFAKTCVPYCMDAMWIVKSSSEPPPPPAVLEHYTYSITFLNYIPTLGWPTHNPLKIALMITDSGGAKTDKCMNKTFYHYDKFSGCTENWKNGGTVQLAYYPFGATSRSYLTFSCTPYTNETLSGYAAVGSTLITMAV